MGGGTHEEDRACCVLGVAPLLKGAQNLPASSVYTAGPHHALFSLSLTGVYHADYGFSTDFAKIESLPVRAPAGKSALGRSALEGGAKRLAFPVGSAGASRAAGGAGVAMPCAAGGAYVRAWRAGRVHCQPDAAPARELGHGLLRPERPHGAAPGAHLGGARCCRNRDRGVKKHDLTGQPLVRPDGAVAMRRAWDRAGPCV